MTARYRRDFGGLLVSLNTCIDDVHVNDLDLHLLPVSDEVCLAGSVSRAAPSHCMTQPSASPSQMRLCLRLRDLLCTRVVDGFVPTPRAHAWRMAHGVQSAIATFEEALVLLDCVAVRTPSETLRNLQVREFNELLHWSRLHETCPVQRRLKALILQLFRVARDRSAGSVKGELTPTERMQ